MMACILLLLGLLAGLRPLESVTVGRLESRPVPGQRHNISRNDAGLQKAVLCGTYTFNNQSNDAFLFRPSSVKDAQEQMVKGVRYFADVEISRTVCRKNKHKDLKHCDFQPDGVLQQTIVCHFEVLDQPWLQLTKTTYFKCH